MYSKTYISLVALILTISYFYGCTKEETDVERNFRVAKSVIDTVQFRCNSYTTDYYFEGSLNGKPICYHDGVDKYRNSSGVLVGFTTVGTNGGTTSTSGATFQKTNLLFAFTNMDIEPFPSNGVVAQRISITTPYSKDSTDANALKLLSKFLKLGNLPIVDNKNNSSEAFNIGLEVLYHPLEAAISSDGYIAALSLETKAGDQTGSFLKCMELEFKQDNNSGKDYYDITFALDCKLYHNERATRAGYAPLVPVGTYQGHLCGIFKTRIDL